MIEIYPAETRGVRLPYCKNFIIVYLQPLLYDRYTCVSDRQTDGRAIALFRRALKS